MHKILKIDKDFKPCPADHGDEFFAQSPGSGSVAHNHNKHKAALILISDLYPRIPTSPRHLNGTIPDQNTNM